MALTQEEAESIKKELLKRLGAFPEEKREEIKAKVESMPVEEVEEFISENKLTHMGGQCIFCSIIAGKVPSFKIFEDKEHIAVLEINPLSKGHSLLIPKNHLESVPESTKELSKKIATGFSKKLSPNEIKINELRIMDHALLEIVPIFGNEGERWQASQEELKSLQEELIKPIEPVEIKPEKPIEPEIVTAKLFRLPPRIP